MEVKGNQNFLVAYILLLSSDMRVLTQYLHGVCLKMTFVISAPVYYILVLLVGRNTSYLLTTCPTPFLGGISI